MYITKQTSVKNWLFEKPGDKTEIEFKGPKTKLIKKERVSEIVENIADWRKFNALHNWMVTNIQQGKDDCKGYLLSKEKIKELLEICKKISNDKILAPKLLPTQSGFFFGKTEYDKYYFEEIERTIKILEEMLKNNNGDYYYQSSW